MLKCQTPMLNDEVCRAMTDKQTHKQTNTQKHKYRVKTEETFFSVCVCFFFSFKKAGSKNDQEQKSASGCYSIVVFTSIVRVDHPQ